MNFNSPSQEGNAIHVLAIAADGRLSEPGPAVRLPVPATAHPQGIVVL